MAVLIEKSGTFDARHIQARSLRWTLFKKLKYVAINSAVAYIPLYLVSSFAALKNIAIDPRLFVFTALLVVFLLFAGALINLVEYLILRFMLSHFWREAARGVVCFGRMVEFGESVVRKRNCLIGKDEIGLFTLRKGKFKRLCEAPYAICQHDRLGVYTPLMLRKVKLRPYLQIEGGNDRFIIDVISPKDMMERLLWTEEVK
ncbi:MAG: hypothetical protein ACLQMF_08495 [Rectinemataceae bacterium]